MIAGSNPASGMDVSPCEFCVLSRRGLRDGVIPHPEESYRVCVCVCACACARVSACVIECDEV